MTDPGPDAPALSRSPVAGPVAAVDSAVRDAGERLIDRVPAVEYPLLVARDAYARASVGTAVVRNRLRHEAPVAPYRLLEVDPEAIEFVAELPEVKFRLAGRVRGGDWDLTDERFVDTDVYRAYRAHFEDDVPWQATDFFHRVVDEIESGRPRWDCTTRAEFEARCDRLDDLYRTIDEEGYRTQAELLAAGGEDPIKAPHRLLTERLKHEIAVHVGREGELLFEDGRNRLAIARLLDLDTVPVRVLLRHEDWQETRDAYVRGDLPADGDVARHPDVRWLSRG